MTGFNKEPWHDPIELTFSFRPRGAWPLEIGGTTEIFSVLI
jgi:hypothetical protein